MQFMCAAPARPVTDFDTGAQKADENGELLFNVQIVALDDEGAQILQLKVPGDPKVDQGTMLRIDGLVALPWSMGDRSGVAFRANRIQSLGANGAGSPQRQPAKTDAS